MATYYHIFPASRARGIGRIGLPEGATLTDRENLNLWIDTFLVDRIEATNEKKAYVVKTRLQNSQVEKEEGRIKGEPVTEYRLLEAVPPDKLKLAYILHIGLKYFPKGQIVDTPKGRTIPLIRKRIKRTTFARQYPERVKRKER